MKKILLLLLIILSTVKAQIMTSENLYNNYEKYKTENLEHRRVSYLTVKELIENLKSKTIFEIEKIGESLNGREIHSVQFGEGEINVLLWSQMHGDESTATRALFDIFNFLSTDDEFNDVKKMISDKLSVYFIPMLNPDGAEKFTRRNELEIDLNRDAIRLQFPESIALKSMHDKLKPSFGFNLHDQSHRYSAGNNFKTASISFLAPPFNYEREINAVRSNTMKLILSMVKELEKFIPGHIGRYSDEFEPRAFGDNFIKWGTSSVLIETGGWKNDEGKNFLRKLNFIAILKGLESIALESYKNMNAADYEKIPENEKFHFDLLLRNLTAVYNSKKYTIDIGINRDEVPAENENYFFYESVIEDFGDLSIYYGIEEIDCTGLELGEGRTAEIENPESLTKTEINDFHKEGVTSLTSNTFTETFTHLPFNFRSRIENPKIAVDSNPEFVILKSGKVKYVCINGFLKDVESKSGTIKNGMFPR
ncbi:MAG: hypothetical protein K8F36_05345 [Melioribacteraceae bacterium]|nr:hypothetical protein [Melioribacteraceae bacterium]